MATAAQNLSRANLAASKSGLLKPPSKPNSFNKLPDNAFQNHRSRLLHAQARGRKNEGRVQKTAKTLGVNRHKSMRQRATGWGGAAIGGALGSAIPFLGTAVGAFIGRAIGNSVLGKWILIGVLVFTLLAILITGITLIAGLQVMCQYDKVPGFALGVLKGATAGAAAVSGQSDICQLFN